MNPHQYYLIGNIAVTITESEYDFKSIIDRIVKNSHVREIIIHTNTQPLKDIVGEGGVGIKVALNKNKSDPTYREDSIVKRFGSYFTATVMQDGSACLSIVDNMLSVVDEYVLNGTDSPTIEPTTLSPEDQLALAKLSAESKINAIYSSEIQKYVGNPTQSERDTWNLKLSIAQAIINKEALAPEYVAYTTSAGLVDQESLDLFAGSVTHKAMFYAKVIGVIDKIKTQVKEELITAKELSSVSDILDKLEARISTELNVS